MSFTEQTIIRPISDETFYEYDLKLLSGSTHTRLTLDIVVGNNRVLAGTSGLSSPLSASNLFYIPRVQNTTSSNPTMKEHIRRQTPRS
jgi:hypothetical protein